MLPFFNVECGTQGVICAIGWTGDWAANLFRTDTGVRMHAGLTRTHLKLLPGEEIRSRLAAQVGVAPEPIAFLAPEGYIGFQNHDRNMTQAMSVFQRSA